MTAFLVDLTCSMPVYAPLRAGRQEQDYPHLGSRKCGKYTNSRTKTPSKREWGGYPETAPNNPNTALTRSWPVLTQQLFINSRLRPAPSNKAQQIITSNR